MKQSNFLVGISGLMRRISLPGTLRMARYFFPPEYFVRHVLETVIPYRMGTRIHINPASFLEWAIFWTGYYNGGVTRLVERMVKRGDYVVDVGANVGQYGLIFCKLAKDGKVFLFEPQPEVVMRLRQNVFLNGFENTVVVAEALSDLSGRGELISFAPGAENQGNATLFDRHHSDLTRKINVPVDTLDNYLKTAGVPRLDFLKIDAQGADLSVLRGSANCIKRYRPIITVRYTEETYDAAGVNLDGLKDWFGANNYRIYRIESGGGLLPIERVPDGAKDFFMVAIPGEKAF